MLAGFKYFLTPEPRAHCTTHASYKICYIIPFSLQVYVVVNHLPTPLRRKVTLRLVKSLAKLGAWLRVGGRRACRRRHSGAEAAAQLLLPTRLRSPLGSHLSRSPPRARPAGNYTSRQDAGARTRTGASAMATVLSRALKLPGKELQLCDHPAPAGPGEMGR